MLAKFLLSKNYNVIGTCRRDSKINSKNLELLGIYNKVKLELLDITDYKSVFELIKNTKPNEIYCLAAQSSVSLSFLKPKETIDSIIIGSLNLLEAVKLSNLKAKIYFAGSSECFGPSLDFLLSEETPLNPKSPYGIAKSSAHWLVKNYRENYGIFSCTGFLFNHESPLRPKNFVTQKIIQSCIQISSGSKDFLELGNLNISRDWGWAPEYVQAMWMMLQLDCPEDFVVATGESHSLKKFVDLSFQYFGLNWKNHVKINNEFFRKTEILESKADIKKAKTILNWKPQKKIDDIIVGMIENRFD